MKPSEPAAALDAAYSALTGVVDDLGDADLLRPTVSTQDNVLAVPDFVATLVTEAVIHHLDLIVSLPDAAGPPDEAVSVALSTMEGLADLPAEWSPAEALRKSAGREELTTADRQALGAGAARFPLIG